VHQQAVGTVRAAGGLGAYGLPDVKGPRVTGPPLRSEEIDPAMIARISLDRSAIVTLRQKERRALRP
jgi:hypothetical protein